MNYTELNRVPARGISITEQGNPLPAMPVPEPGLMQKLSFMPSAIARAIFEEGPWPSRKIPPQCDEVLIRPGRGFGTSNSFELPAIGEGLVANNKKVEVINLTRNVHRVTWNDPLDGAVLEIELDGVGSNAQLRVIGGRWIVVGLHKATEK